jgi:hypothetical protein
MSWLRERKLLSLVETLWHELTAERQAELRPELADVAWALPKTLENRYGPDDLLTTAEVAAAFGMKPAGVWSWSRRYGIKTINGKWRWADVHGIRFKQVFKNPAA